jgi:hypothetical protein
MNSSNLSGLASNIENLIITIDEMPNVTGLPRDIPAIPPNNSYLKRANYELSVIDKTSTETRPGQNWDRTKSEWDKVLLTPYEVAYGGLRDFPR